MTEDEKGRPAGGGPSILTSDSTATLDYLRSVYGEHFAGTLVVSTYPENAAPVYRHFTTIHDAAAYAVALDAQGIHKGIYCTGATVKHGVSGRGRAPDTQTLYYLSIDMDVWHPIAHKKSKLPRCLADCRDLVTALGFPEPTRWIDSGFGFYPQ